MELKALMYWVDAKVIDHLKDKEAAKEEISINKSREMKWLQ